MTDIKKPYVELIELLQANEGKKVSALLPQILEMCTSKVAQETFRTDADGKVTEIFCWYHKQWESLDEHEYGAKANTKTGYNRMCKKGVNTWTKQQSDAKKAKAQLIEDVANGKIEPQELPLKLEEIEETRNQIIY